MYIDAGTPLATAQTRTDLRAVRTLAAPDEAAPKSAGATRSGGDDPPGAIAGQGIVVGVASGLVIYAVIALVLAMAGVLP